MTQNNNSWRKTYFTLLAGQAISFISSGILQMAIIFYLVAKTNSFIIQIGKTRKDRERQMVYATPLPDPTSV